ncbi:hypothetical protein MMC18_003359 [Xylographa bjoerkii]|nr:hypothetical protein [Xylographa bjoerkii]
MAAPLSFLSLPPELRQKVYSDLLVTKDLIVIKIYDCNAFDRIRYHASDDPDDSDGDTTYTPRICPAILSTCRIVHDEAQSILYSANFFILPDWPPDLDQYSIGNVNSPTCTDHAYLPPTSCIRKIYSHHADRDWLLTQGLWNLLRPGSLEIKTQWKPFPLGQVNEIVVGFERTKWSPRSYQMVIVLRLFLGMKPTDLVKLMAEWYARGEVKVTFLGPDRMREGEMTRHTNVTEGMMQMFEEIAEGRREVDAGDDEGTHLDDSGKEERITTNRVFDKFTKTMNFTKN